MTKHFDIAIIGSGFSGSILAWILASQGRSVAIIDPVSHPRFAIGESSTPIADLLLRLLGETYGLSELEQLSSYGSWQQHQPQLACGRKRGFSYYLHEPEREFNDTPDHQRSLMVAASASDSLADTHWYRRDVDQFLFGQALAAGAESFMGHLVRGIEPDQPNRISLSHGRQITADWIVDASGRTAVTAGLLDQEDLTGKLMTNTRSVFAHFRKVRSWRGILIDCGVNIQQDPFHTDDSAQHHLHRDGWIWMLRFNNGVTSVGWTSSKSAPSLEITSRYPSIQSLLRDAELVEPAGGPTTTDRLQRWFHPIVTPRCLMLPATACTIDPLHSTGIAHSLAGVRRIARIVLSGETPQQYASSLMQEARLLDRLVSTAYGTMHDFPRFTAACMLYFTGAIACEERILSGEDPQSLWSADDERYVQMANACCDALINDPSTQQVIDRVRNGIQPWNTAGLMDPSVSNRYAYTATKRSC